MRKVPVKRECLHCKTKKRKLKSDTWFMVAIDRPYANLWFHRKCYKRYSQEELVLFLSNNVDLWYN